MKFAETMVIVMIASISAAQARDIVGQGRAAAMEDCSACHQVTAAQRPPAPVFDPDEARNVPAPSFREIARRHGGKPRLLRQTITNPRHPMREQQFEAHDLSAIIAFIQSLSRH